MSDQEIIQADLGWLTIGIRRTIREAHDFDDRSALSQSLCEVPLRPLHGWFLGEVGVENDEDFAASQRDRIEIVDQFTLADFFSVWSGRSLFAPRIDST